jgi:methylglyoxal synthase
MGEVDAVVFLADSLPSQPHEPDIRTLLRVCNLHDVPPATNLGSADLLMDAVAASWLAEATAR